jgi:tRNA modification GTPase
VRLQRGDGLEELERSLAAVVQGGDVAVEGGAWTANQRQAEAMQTALGGGALRHV